MSHRVTELHSIMPIANIPSVMQNGILSHEEASMLSHYDISLSDVQDRREVKYVPGGLKLHQYANLYFYARNPMLYKRSAYINKICILRVSKTVLNAPGVVISDRNAASKYASFYKSPQGLRHVDFDLVFAEYWKHPEDQIAEWRHTSIKCAEVLVPNRVKIAYFEGAYVANKIAKSNLENAGFNKIIEINEHLFFV